MAEWKTPNITIGDIPIIAQDFNWALTAGVIPFQTTIIMLNDHVNEALKQIQNPTTISWEVTGGSEGQPDQHVMRFENVYLIEPKMINPFQTMWTIADSRFAWRGKKLYFSYNKTRIKNQTGTAVNAPSNDPAILRQLFDRYKKGRYLPWSVKDGTDPYNMKEIIESELAKLGIIYDPLISDDKGAFIVENVEMEGEDIYKGISSLLARSRLNMGILPSGNVYVYSIDFFDETQVDVLKEFQKQKRKRPGILYKQDMKRLRPKIVKIRFPRKIETRVVASDSEDTNPLYAMAVQPKPPVWDQADIDDWRVIGCENVIRVPYPFKSITTGLEHQIGEFVPMWEYLKSIGLDPALVRQFWFSGYLITQLTLILSDPASPSLADEQRASHIAAAIKSHYRQVYRIDPFYMDRMERWEAKRVGVVNNYDRYSPVSPLYSDYCVIPKLRVPHVAKRTAVWTSMAYNWEVEQQDPYRRRPTAGSVVTVSHPLGIFRITYPSMIDMVLEKIIPGALDPLPTMATGSTNMHLKSCHLKPTHTMETVLSVVWSTDTTSAFSGIDKYVRYELDYSSLGGEGPDIDYLSKLEYARYSMKILDDEGQPANNFREVVNDGLLSAIAQSEGAKIINSFKDRYSGFVSMDGFVDISLTGNIKAIAYSYTEEYGFETHVDMRDIPAAPTLEQTLPQSALNFLQGQVTRGDNVNEVKGV